MTRFPAPLFIGRSINSQESASNLVAFSNCIGDSSRQRTKIGIEPTDNYAGVVWAQAVKTNKMATVHSENATPFERGKFKNTFIRPTLSRFACL
jgi:hypothetical protein